jgi:PST family polysaccharide transporter
MKKSLFNVFCLATMQGANAVLPLVLFPFVLGIVGEHYYSKLVITEALQVYLLAAVLYSFEIDGVGGVANLHVQKDAARIAEMLGGIVVARTIIFLIFAPLMWTIAWFIDPELLMPALGWSLAPLAYAIQPNWLFQGLRKNEVAATVTVLTRGLAVLITILVVHDSSRFALVPAIIGFTYLLGALLALAYAFLSLNLRFSWPRPSYLREIVANGWYIFLGNLGVVVYRESNVLILAAIGASAPVIATYSLAEKLVKALQAVIRPLNQHFMPHAMKLAKEKESRSEIMIGLWKLTAPQILALLAVVLMIYMVFPWAHKHIGFVSRIRNLDEVVAVVSVMCIGAFFGVANFMLGSAGLNAMGERKFFFMSIIVAGFVGAATCALAGAYWGVYGAASAFVLSEATLQILILSKYVFSDHRRLAWR